MKDHQLRFLILSDIHFAFDNLKLLIEKHLQISKYQCYDYILILGDFANLNHKDPELTESY